MGLTPTLAQLTRMAGTVPGKGTTLQGLAKAAASLGLHPQGVQVSRAALASLPTPAIAWINGNHYAALLSLKGDKATLYDPNLPAPSILSIDALLRHTSGYFLLLKRASHARD